MAGLAFVLNIENTNYKENSYDYMNQSDYIISPIIRYYLNSFYIQVRAMARKVSLIKQIEVDFEKDLFSG